MYKQKKFLKNCEGVSELTGEILLTGIVVLFFSAMSIYTLLPDRAAHIPHADLQVSMNVSSGTIYLEHRGGETIDPEELKIVVIANGTETTLSPENISAKLGGSNMWEMGDLVEIDLKNEWGVAFEKGDPVELFLIYTPSNQVIQRMDVSAS